MEQSGQTNDRTLLAEQTRLLEEGNRKFMRGDYHGAIADFSKAIELNASDASAYYSRGLAYLGQGQKALAKEGLLKAMELGYQVPREALDMCNLG